MNDFPEFKDYLHNYLATVKDRYTKEGFQEIGLIPTPKLIEASIDQHVRIAQRNYLEELQKLINNETFGEKEKEERRKYLHCRRVVLTCVAWEVCNASLLVLHNNDTSVIWINFHLIVAIMVGVAFSFMIRPFIAMFIMDIKLMKKYKEMEHVRE